MQVTWSVLVIEDTDVDREFLLRLLTREAACQCKFAGRLSEGIEYLADSAFNVILLDLNLPDCHELEGLLQLRAHASHIPVVVLTGIKDDKNAYRAVQHGAQDYLVKGTIEGPLLIRSMGYAIERHRLLHELDETRQREPRERELRMLETAVATTDSTETACAFGQLSLRKANPSEFDELVEHYGSLIEHALEQRTFKVDHHIGRELRSLADRLGNQRARARDIVELHTIALKTKTSGLPQTRVSVCTEEARYILLELMGHLCSHYRAYSLGSSAVTASSTPAHTGNAKHMVDSKEKEPERMNLRTRAVDNQ